MPPLFRLPTRRDRLVVDFTIFPNEAAGSWNVGGNTYPYNRQRDNLRPGDAERYGGLAVPLNQPIIFTAQTKAPNAALRAIHYRWNFGDGTTATGPQVRKVFSQSIPGITVTLTVTDNRGGQVTRARIFSTSRGTVVDPDALEFPKPPTGLSLTTANASLGFAFTAPTLGEQNLPILSYQYTINSGTTWTTVSTSPSGGQQIGTISGLTNGVAYTVAIRAVNSTGPGPPSQNATATPSAPTAPSAPTGLSASPGSTQVSLTWTPGATNDPATSWQWSTDGSSWTTLAATTIGSQRTFTVTALTNGTTYAFRVRGVNATGNGASSSIVNVTPIAPAAAPLAAVVNSATPGNATVQLIWTPDASGDPATSWQYTTNGGTNWATVTAATSGATRVGNVTQTSLAVALSNGTSYTFAVRGVNTAGNGASSNSIAATPIAPVVAPGAPTALGAAAGDAQVVLTFTPPTTGDAVTSYQYTTNGGTSWTTFTTSVSGSQRTGTITGLTNGTTYTFAVRGVNAGGNGTSSGTAAATPSAPATAPNAATGLTAAGGNQQITLNWTPAATGGTATSWQYTTNGGTNWVTFTTTPAGSSRTGTITQTSTGTTLANGTSYTVQVRGVNTGGNGAASNSASATPTAPSAGSGTNMWLSTEMISAASTSGAAWTNVVNAANASFGTPAIGDQDNKHDTNTLAGALYYAKTGDSAMRTKVKNAIAAVQGTESSGPFGTYSAARALAIGRNLGAYPIAAQLIGLAALDSAANTTFSNWLNAIHTFNTTGGGETSILNCMDSRPNNWGTWCQFGCLAAAVYTGNTSRKNHVVDVMKGWLGNRTVYAGFNYGGDGWQADTAARRGINSQGTTKVISGAARNVDGCVPDDQRRSLANYDVAVWPPVYTDYFMEACEGVTGALWILHRLGEGIWTYENSAIIRAHTWFQNVAGFSYQSNHAHTPWLLNKAGYSQFTRVATTPGKGYGYVDWSHA